MAFLNLPPLFLTLSREEKMQKSRPHPPRPDRRRSIRGSFSWIDHRFLREGFDQGLTRLEKLLYFVLVAVSNQVPMLSSSASHSHLQSYRKVLRRPVELA